MIGWFREPGGPRLNAALPGPSPSGPAIRLYSRVTLQDTIRPSLYGITP